jgi:hypothetical protein
MNGLYRRMVEWLYIIVDTGVQKGTPGEPMSSARIEMRTKRTTFPSRAT